MAIIRKYISDLFLRLGSCDLSDKKRKGATPVHYKTPVVILAISAAAGVGVARLISALSRPPTHRAGGLCPAPSPFGQCLSMRVPTVAARRDPIQRRGKKSDTHRAALR